MGAVGKCGRGGIQRLQDSNWVQRPAHNLAVGSSPNFPHPNGGGDPSIKLGDCRGSAEPGGCSPRAASSVRTPAKHSTCPPWGRLPQITSVSVLASPPAGLAVLSSPQRPRNPCTQDTTGCPTRLPLPAHFPTCSGLLGHLSPDPALSAGPAARSTQTTPWADAELGSPRRGWPSQPQFRVLVRGSQLN